MAPRASQLQKRDVEPERIRNVKLISTASCLRPLKRGAPHARVWKGKRIRRPISRVLFRHVRRRPGRSFICDAPCDAPEATYPDDMRRHTCGTRPRSSLFGLAPGGACHAPFLAVGAVRSYRTLSPLPPGAEAMEGGLLSAALSLGLPPPGATRHLASMEPGLSSTAPFPACCRDRPAT